MGGLSPVHLIIILVIALVILGPGKLPETGAAIGKAIREFRHATADPIEPVPVAPMPAIEPPVAAGETGSPNPPSS